MNYEQWKQLKRVPDENNGKILREFERNNPGLTAHYMAKCEKERSEMNDIMKVSDRKERWRAIANSKYAYDPTFAERRRRETM